MARVIVYIDGFNLYYGLKELREKGKRNYYWLNIQRLMQELLEPDQSLVTTKYFTSRIKAPTDKQQRQSLFIDALSTLRDFEIFYGRYDHKSVQCRYCRATHFEAKEKMTDVNIAIQMMADVFQDKYDTALLISGDSDLEGVIATIIQLFPSKRVVVGFPPNRRSSNLASKAHASFNIREPYLARSLFPNEVITISGVTLTCPKEWR